MDGFPSKKGKLYGGQLYSETRFAIIEWLKKELPSVSGDLINLGAGGWQVPKQLLDPAKIKNYKTFDQKVYGKNSNKVDIYGDIQFMPVDWTSKWDVALCVEVVECVPNIIQAFNEMHRILKPGGTLLLTCPFNYRWFGDGSWNDKSKDNNGVVDYWRPTKQGLELLAKQFSKVSVIGFGGTGVHDSFVHCMKAVK